MATSPAAGPNEGLGLPPAALLDAEPDVVAALLRDPAPGTELWYWLRFFAALPTSAPSSELERVLAREREHRPNDSELEIRAHWLRSGTTDHQLLGLDPRADCDRIHQRVLSRFRVESRVLETLAINRIAQSTSLLLLIRATRKAESEPALRFFDTYSLLANALEWGVHSERGARAVARINDVHSRYEIPNDGMLYILLETAFTWLHGAERIAHRPLHPIEREGFFHAYAQLGVALGIRGLTHDYAAMERWVGEFNAAHRSFHPSKRDTYERVVDASLTAVPFASLAYWFKVCLRAGMDETYREATGQSPLTQHELRVAQRLLSNLGQAVEDSNPAPLLRSLAPNPARSVASEPEQLGSSERTPRLPPQRAPHELPWLTRAEVRLHCHPSSAWLIIDDEVFDVTELLQIHPGGREVLSSHAGTDATHAFNQARHPELVRVLRNNYRIGRVPAEVDAAPGGPANVRR